MSTRAESLLIKVCRILEEHNIHYWICNGTLLGIIRENRILPWDHDIDFGVFSDQVDKDTINEIFLNHNFSTEEIHKDNDCLHFLKGKCKVDINFFTKENGSTFVEWVVLGNGCHTKIKNFLLLCLIKSSPPQGKLKIIKFLTFYMLKILKLFLNTFSKTFLQMLIKYLNKELYVKMGYSYPSEMLNQFIDYDFNGYNLRIPDRFTEILALTYGADWKVPRKNFVWYEQATNLTNNNSYVE